MKKIKFIFLGLILLFIAAIIAIPFIPADQYKTEIQEQVRTATGLDVNFNELHFTSLPSPALVVDNFELGQSGQALLNVERIRISPKISALFSAQPALDVIHVIRPQTSEHHLKALLGYIAAKPAPSGDPSYPTIFIDRIAIEDGALLLDNGKKISAIELDIGLDKSLQPQTLLASIDNKHLSVQLNSRTDNAYDLQINGQDWTPPVEPAIKLERINATGSIDINTQELLLSSINLQLFDGSVDGNLKVVKTSPVSVHGEIVFSGLNTGQLLTAVNGNRSIDGISTGRFKYSLDPLQVEDPIASVTATGEVSIKNGVIYNADLESAARNISSEWKSGGQTEFDELRTLLNIQGGSIELSDLSVTSSILSASGKIKLKQMERLNGTIKVGLNDPTGLISMPLLVSGTVEEPKIRPTDEALAGAAVGTALLGPGVGTAVGVKAGEILGKIGSLFGSDENAESDKDK